MEKLETYLNKHPDMAKLIDWNLTTHGLNWRDLMADPKEAYYFSVNVGQTTLALGLDHRAAGKGHSDSVANLEAPNELLEEAVERAGGQLNRSGSYPLHPALKAWVEARIQAWERDYPRLYDLADMLIAEVLTRLLPALMEDQKKTREILTEIRDLLKNHTA